MRRVCVDQRQLQDLNPGLINAEQSKITDCFIFLTLRSEVQQPLLSIQRVTIQFWSSVFKVRDQLINIQHFDTWAEFGADVVTRRLKQVQLPSICNHTITLTHNMWLHICVWAVFYLNKVVQDGFAGHVTVDSVVSIQEVRSEMMQQRVQVYRVITALLTAVNTLTALKRKPHTNRDHVMKLMLSFLSAGAEFPHVWDVCERCFSQNFCHSFGSTELNNMIRISQVNCDFLPGGKTSIDQFWAKIHSSVDVKLIWGSSSLS